MDQQTYLKKFSHFVRWRLPKPEADEVLADYEALFSERLPGNDDAWIQDLGEPLEATRLLTEPKVYRRWRALYIMGLMVLVECVLVIANLVSMDLGSLSSGWWVSRAVSLSAIDLAGLAGAGVSLC